MPGPTGAIDDRAAPGLSREPGSRSAGDDPFDGQARFDAFISYRRITRDTAFVDRLEGALAERGKSVWLDRAKIEPAADWSQRITRGITAAKAFIFVITPESVVSEECRRELEIAAQQNKLIIPIVLRNVDNPLDIPEPLSRANWIVYRRGRDSARAFDEVVQALEADLDWRDEHARLVVRTNEWVDAGRDRSFLLRGSDLRSAEEWLGQAASHSGTPPTIQQTEYILVSRQAATRTQRTRLGALSVALVVSVGLAAFAFVQRQQAIQQRDQAIHNQVIAEALQFGSSDTPLAAQLNLAAYRMQATPDLASRLLSTENTPLPFPLTTGTGNIVNSVAFSPDGHTLASGSFDGAVRLWDAADPAHPRPLGHPLTSASGFAISTVEFSPDGHILASGDAYGAVQLWDVANPAHPRPLGQPLNTGRYNSVYSVAFSPNGHTLASGSVDGGVRMWDVADPAHPRPLVDHAFGRGFRGGILGRNNAVYTVAFSPDGHTLASGYSGKTWLWDVADLAHPRPLNQPITTSTSMALSPLGHILASGYYDGTVRLWDVADPAHPRPLGQPLTTGSGSPVRSVAFSLDGHTLASGNDDGAIWLWDVADPTHPQPLGQPLTSGSGNTVRSVAFSPDGHALASGNADGMVRLWNLPQTILATGGGIVYAVAFSPDGHTLASGGLLGTIRLWDVTDPAHPRPFDRPLTSGTTIYALAFSPDGHILASGSFDGAVRLWDVADPAHPRPLGQPLTSGSGSPVRSVAFSSYGHTLASGNDDGTIRLWDVADPAHPSLLSQLASGIGRVFAMAFSPHGHILATGGTDGAWLWDVVDLANPRPFDQPLTSDDTIFALAFSPDGHTLASGGLLGAVRLWDVADPAHLRPLGQPPTNGDTIYALAFSPDGHTLVSGTIDGTIGRWDVADPAHPQPLGQPLTNGSGAINAVAFSAHGYTLASGSNDGITRLWNLKLQYAIERICTTAGGLTPPQWHEYISLLPYQPSCGH